MLHRREFLTRETLFLFIKKDGAEKAEKAPPTDPIMMSASLQKKHRELGEESRKLQELSERIRLQQKELEADRKALENRLKALQTKTAEEMEVASGGDEATKLVKMYEGMPPDEAAAILEKLPDSAVAQILLQMRRRQAAQIMASMNPVKAADVSQMIFPEIDVSEN